MNFQLRICFCLNSLAYDISDNVIDISDNVIAIGVNNYIGYMLAQGI